MDSKDYQSGLTHEPEVSDAHIVKNGYACMYPDLDVVFLTTKGGSVRGVMPLSEGNTGSLMIDFPHLTFHKLDAASPVNDEIEGSKEAMGKVIQLDPAGEDRPQED